MFSLYSTWNLLHLSCVHATFQSILFALSRFVCWSVGNARYTYWLFSWRFLHHSTPPSPSRLNLPRSDCTDAGSSAQVNSDDAKRFALEINSHLPEGTFSSGAVPFFETSSKSGDGVDNLFTFIFEHLLERTDSEPIVETVNPGEVESEKPHVKKETTCCKNWRFSLALMSKGCALGCIEVRISIDFSSSHFTWWWYMIPRVTFFECPASGIQADRQFDRLRHNDRHLDRRADPLVTVVHAG